MDDVNFNFPVLVQLNKACCYNNSSNRKKKTHKAGISRNNFSKAILHLHSFFFNPNHIFQHLAMQSDVCRVFLLFSVLS